MKFLSYWLGVTLVGSGIALATPARAEKYLFSNITNNNPINAALGESTLWMDVNAVGDNQVSFTFSNSNTNSRSPVITQLYWDGNPLSSYLSFNRFGSSTGIANFKQVRNGVLPGGNGSLINFTVDYQVDAINPRPTNGIGGGETLALNFNLMNGTKFNNILDQLSTGALRVGMHVQAFSDGGSEGFINRKSNPSVQAAPEPITLLGSIAAIGYGTLLQRQRRRKTQSLTSL